MLALPYFSCTLGIVWILGVKKFGRQMAEHKLEDIYTADWFERVERMERHSAVCMADIIFRHLQPGTVLDLGCGPAAHANALAEKGCEVTTVDGVQHAARFVRPPARFVLADLCQPLNLRVKFDAVLCLEVAEHLPESAEDILCQTLARHTGNWLVFTAAPPGQKGRFHINLKPMQHWMSKLSTAGLSHQPEMTADWQKLWRGMAVMDYFIDNLMIFSAAKASVEDDE